MYTPHLSKLEIKRKLFHLVFGLFIVALIKFELITALDLFISTVIFLVFCLISKKKEIPIFNWFIKNLEREDALKKFPGSGALLYLVGSLAVVYFFEKDIALTSITILAVGDSFSHLIGKQFGKVVHPFTNKKFIEGAIAGAILAAFAALLFVEWHEALIASVAAMIVEGIDIKIGETKIDDNLTMPIASSVVIWLIRGFV